MDFYKRIIDRYVNNSASADELEVMDHLLRKGLLDGPLEKHMQQAWDIETDIFDMENQRKKGKVFPWKWVTSIAASIALILIGSYMLYRPGLPQHAQNLKPIVPGTDKAILTLADGKQISLTDSRNGQVVNLSGISVVKNNDGTVEYRLAKVANEHAVEFNNIETPRGGQYTIHLTDGTIVTLNAASNLKFPTSFNGNKRVVELSGEGYFEVAKDRSRPFMVKTSGQEVEVLGTHFNIKGYKDENTAKTTLLEGSVRINGSTYLTPGQQAVVTPGSIKVVNADLEAETAWKEGRIAFTGNDFENIMRTISRWYDVEIVYDYNPKDLRISGGISRFQNIKDVLELLQETGDVKFKIEGRRIRVIK